MHERKTLLAYALASVAGVVIAMAAMALRKPEPPDRAAQTFLTAAITGNAATLYRYESPVERKADSTSPEKIARLWDSLIRPALAGYTPVGPPRVYLEGNGMEGLAMQDLVDRNGRRSRLGIEAYKTDDGPKATFSQAIRSAICISYFAHNPGGPAKDPKGFRAFVLAAYSRAYPEFLAARFTTLVDFEPWGPHGYDVRPVIQRRLPPASKKRQPRQRPTRGG